MSSITDWSKTAANNASSDSGINWAEGQAPSTVNNSARAMMGRVAEWRDDLGGVTTTGGTANAITVTANSAFTTYATGRIVTFKATADNTTGITLNVNSIGAKVGRKFAITGGESALGAGDIQEGGVYTAIYDAALNSSAGGWHIYNTSLGTASTRDTGTSGAALPLLNASNTWSAGTTQIFDGDIVLGRDNADIIYFEQQTAANPGVSNTTTGGAFFQDSLRVSNATSVAIYANVNANAKLFSARRSGTDVGGISVTGTSTSFETSSDARLKNNLRDFDSGGFLDALDVWLFDWTQGGTGYGVIAQEAQKVFPDAVTINEDGWHMVDYSKFVPVLLREVKALRARMALAESRLTGGRGGRSE